nr:ribonuclease kappa-like [Camelus dromedarius]
MGPSVLWAQAGRLRHRPQRLGSDHVEMLGIFFNVHSAVLIEDVPFTEKDFENGPQNIYNLYEQVSYNCFIAAGLYLSPRRLLFCQVRLNHGKETWCARAPSRFPSPPPPLFKDSPHLVVVPPPPPTPAIHSGAF